MLNHVFKGSLATSVLMLGIAALLAAQNGRFQYLPEKEVLVDSRTGDTFMIADRPDGAGKFIQRLNLRTGSLREVPAIVEPELALQKRDAELSDCRTSLKVVPRQDGHGTSISGPQHINDLFAANDAMRCISSLNSQGKSESLDDRSLVSEFCQAYLKRDRAEIDSGIETTCAQAGVR